MVILDVIICIAVVIWGVKLKNNFRTLNKTDHKVLRNLFYYHLLGGLAYYLYVTSAGGGDAFAYWEVPKRLTADKVWQDVWTLARPTQFMYLFNFLPSNGLSLSVFTGTIIYSIFGYLGIIYLYLIIKKLVPNYQLLHKVKVWNVSVFPTILFFPNLHFWSSGSSKDTLLFFAVLLFIYSTIKPLNFVGITVSLLISICLRPHVALFLIVGFGIALVLDGKLKVYQKVILVSIFIVMSSFSLNYVMNFARLEALDTSTIEQFSQNKAKVLASGGSGVDISGYPYYLKLATFLFRPLFFDIHNPIAILASCENLFLILLTIKFIKARPIRLLGKSNYVVIGSLIFFIIGSMAFALILGNLGIMLREKNMLFPAFFIALLWVISVRNIKKRVVIAQSNRGQVV